LLLALLPPTLAGAQGPSPWTGALGRELYSFASAGERSLSADGRIVVFETNKPLAPDDTNGVYDVYARDTHSGLVFRASVGTGPIPGVGAPQGDQASHAASVSADGRHVIFQTRSSFDPTDTNGVSDLYVRDLGTGITSLVTVGPDNRRLDCNCAPFAVGRFSGDGRFIVFNAAFNFSPVDSRS
jgi:Tol biopolymer transport system component